MTIPYYNPNLLLWVVVGIVVRLVVCSPVAGATAGTLALFWFWVTTLPRTCCFSPPYLFGGGWCGCCVAWFGFVGLWGVARVF